MSDQTPPPGRRPGAGGPPADRGRGDRARGASGDPDGGTGQGSGRPRRPPEPRGADARRRENDADDAAVAALRTKLAGVLRRLPDVERRVLELRMGLVDGVPAKPGQVAERLGLTIAEVRTIETRAFTRIREVGSIKGLERFLGRPADPKDAKDAKD